jgi:hypothetical protein
MCKATHFADIACFFQTNLWKHTLNASDYLLLISLLLSCTYCSAAYAAAPMMPALLSNLAGSTRA